MIKKHLLGGGFKYFLCSPQTLGKGFPFWPAYVSNGLVQPPNKRLVFHQIIQWVFPKIGVPPKSSILIGISINESSILGYPYFWKHLYPHFAVQSLDSTTTRWKSNSVPVTWLLLIIAEVGFGNVQRPFRVGKAGCLAVRNSVETFKNGTLCMVKLAKK